MDRRSLLRVIPVAGVALTIPSVEDSPLRALYRQWQGTKDEYNALPEDRDSATEGRIFDEMLRLEQEAADFEPQTVEDLIFKIIFADDNGDMDSTDHQKALVARAYAMAGIEPRIRNGA